MTESKPHRFDHFALKMAANMISAIRTTLGVFTSPDKERWPATRLLDYLKGAEDLAREMLREVATKIFVYALPERASPERYEPLQERSAGEQKHAPYFRLGVVATKGSSPEEKDDSAIGRSPEQREPEGYTSNAQAQRPSEAGIATSKSNNSEHENQSIFSTRLEALEDVLAHPGKHAARMARALYRIEDTSPARLMARSEHDIAIDHCANMATDAAYRSSAAGEFMQRWMLRLEAG